MTFVGGLNTRITNSRWRTAAILKKWKNRHISATVRVATKYGTTTHIDPLNPIEKSKMADGSHFEKSKNGHISSAVRPIATKFGMTTNIQPLNPASR